MVARPDIEVKLIFVLTVQDLPATMIGEKYGKERACEEKETRTNQAANRGVPGGGVGEISNESGLEHGHRARSAQ